MTYIDLTDINERRKAVADGYIWSAPQGAIIAALKDIAAGRIDPPAVIPDQFANLARQYGVEPAAVGGLQEGQGPA